MRLIHRAIKSPVFELIGTYEIDLTMESGPNEDSFTLRIELFRSKADGRQFRWRVWRDEMFRIQSTFPQDETGKPEHGSSDETLLTAFSQPHLNPSNDFYADTPERALRILLEQIGKSLEHVTLDELKILE